MKHKVLRLFLGGSARRALKAEQAVERRFEADGKFADDITEQKAAAAGSSD